MSNKQRPQVPTLATVAAKVGLSKSAVSLALRRDPSIPEATRARVEKAAEDLGYRINPFVAMNMARVKSRNRQAFQATIAIVTPDESKGISDVRRELNGARKRAESLGFKIDYFELSKHGLTIPRLRDILVHRGIQGVILAPSYNRESEIDFPWDEFSVVVIGYYMRRLPLHRVAFDMYSDIEAVLERAWNMGYRKMGFVIDRRLLIRTYGISIAGFQQFRLFHPDLNSVEPLICESLNYTVFKEWYNRFQPDIVIGHDWIRIKGYLAKMKLSVPRDVGYAGILAIPEAKDATGPFHSFETLGASALDLVIEKLVHNERGFSKNAKLVLLSGEWNEGGTMQK